MRAPQLLGAGYGQPRQDSTAIASTGPGGGVAWYWSYFAAQRVEAGGPLGTLHDGGGAVDPDPPERRPVLRVVVDEECDGGLGAHVLEALERQRRLRLGVDGGVHGRADQREAARHQMRPPVGAHGAQPPDPGRRDAGTHRLPIHGGTVRRAHLSGLDGASDRVEREGTVPSRSSAG